jgi:8-oxo-dGTP pyrophosphatase MutT (NUDIX family)
MLKSTNPSSGRPADAPQAAVALIRISGRDPEYLLLRRAANPKDPWSGHFALPGGRREDTDHELLDTAIREAFEECGVRLTRQNLVQSLPLAMAGGWMGRPLVVAPFLFQVDAKPSLSLQDEEIAEYHWLALSYLCDPENRSSAALSGRNPDMLFPCIRVGTGAIWGFTYGVLKSFMELG